MHSNNYLNTLLTTLALCLALVACSDGSDKRPVSSEPLVFDASGFFQIEQAKGRWWLIDPQGKPFYSVGLNHISSGGYTDAETGQCPYCATIEEKYGDIQQWRNITVDRLVDWGFNTIGAWSDREGFDDRVTQTPILYMSGGVDDFFSDELAQRARSQIEAKVAPYVDAPWIIGWFLDNEMDWGKDWRGSSTSLDDYLALPEGSPGRTVAETYDGDAEGFLLALASRYFEVTTTILRDADPNHLVLGIRASTIATPPQVVEASAPWLDAFSVNHYDLPENVSSTIYRAFSTTPIDGWLERYHELSGLPLMITEFTYRSSESDVPNTFPPIYYTFPSQAERAAAYRNFAERSYDSDYIVGHHWFEYFDDPPGGRSDGEDSNFGLVSNTDQPYQTVINTMVETHQYAPHMPQGQQRTAERRKKQPVLRLQQGVVIEDHLVESIALYDNAPAGRYTFSVSEPAPLSGMPTVELWRDGKPVAGLTTQYRNDFNLPPSNEPPLTYTFDFPGYLKLGIAGEPGPYRYISTFNIYNTVFDGERFLEINEQGMVVK